MRIPLSHSLGKDEVRSRMKARSHEIADAIPGGMAEVTTHWPSEDCMALDIHAAGSKITAKVEIEEDQVVFDVDLPRALSFFEPMIAGAIRNKGQKLLAP